MATTKVMNKRIVILFLISILFSCNDGENVKVIERWENGNIETVRSYINVDDSLTYLYENYHENGMIAIKGVILNNQKDGIWEWWYSNGNKMDKATLSNGYYYGQRKHWREDGTLRLVEILEGECIGDCCDGKLVYYNEQGIKLIEYTKLNGQRDGGGIVYYQTGEIKKEFTYVEGEKQGINYEYYKNGKIRVEGVYLDDMEEGVWVHRDSIGNITLKNSYEKGILQGTSFEYYSNGNIKFKGEYIDGKEEGYWLFHDSTGELESKGFYVNGELKIEKRQPLIE